MQIVILGLSITSSWGNGHATTYRALVRELAAAGHSVLFLERDVPWYGENRDMPDPPGATTRLYASVPELRDRFTGTVREADFVVVGSYVPEGIAIGEWVTRTASGVTAFYDIDTPVTLAALAGRGTEYISRALIPRYHLYLSFTGGPTLARLEREFDAQMARPLYCSVDTRCYYPEPADDAATAAAPSEAAGAAAVGRWDLGYLGTYSDDRQASLTELMLKPARTLTRQRFVVAGPQYPSQVAWPSNLTRIEHLSPGEHRHFYNHQRYTLNITRADMIRSGWSPSVRLFEAAACGTPIISDWWEGLDHFFEPGADILLARSAADTITCLTDVAEEERRAIGSRGRARVLARHTAAHRARELEAFALEAISAGAGR